MSNQGSNAERTGAEYVYDALVEAGVEVIVGLPGTQTLPLDRIVAERDEMEYVMARHETAIPHVAWGHYESGGGVAATLTVPGPGDTNAMHGLKNALEDCVPIVHVSADVNPADRGKGPIHEIESDTFDNVVKANVNVESALALREGVERAIGTALAPPTGPVRLGVPNGLLAGAVDAPLATVEPERVFYDNTDACERAVELLAGARRPVLYVGGGAARSPEGARVVGALADALEAPVLSSYKGKGVFPEDDPRFVGVTAGHLHAGGRRVLEHADVVLALGTDFDGVTTAGWDLPMGEQVIHVNLAPEDVGVAYDADVAIVDDVGVAGDALLSGLDEAGADGTDAESWDGARVGEAVRAEYLHHLDALGLLDGTAPTNQPAVLRTLRERLPRETVVTTDVGGYRLWAFQTFEAYTADSYVTAGSWAGMGVGLPAAIGAKVANPDRPVVTLTGDGGLMMCIHELHTAAELDLDVVVVVLNDADYGIISKQPGIEAYGDGRRFAWNSPDFATIAEGFGCRATRVESASAAGDAVEEALARADGPALIDVTVRRDAPSVYDAAEYDSTVELQFD